MLLTWGRIIAITLFFALPDFNMILHLVYQGNWSKAKGVFCNFGVYLVVK